jgi:predicted dehydrogenase
MIRAGIIGLGKMGISHCSILGAHPGVQLVAVCDSSSLVLEAFKKYSQYQCFSDFRKMIDTCSLHCVLIASPTKVHSEMVSYALNNSLHVFCEKPFSLDPSEGMKLAAQAKLLGLVNQVGYHNRFIATFNELKRLLESKILGSVYHFTAESYGPVVLKERGGTWRSEKNQGGGCLYDYASHTIDLVSYLFTTPVSVSGTNLKRIFSKDVEDAVYCTLALQNGLTGQLAVNWSDDTYRKMSTQITVIGKEGKIVADATELKIYLKDDNKQVGLSRGWTTKSITDLTENVNFYLRGEEYSAQIDHFIECILNLNIHSRSSFESATTTDHVISLLLKNA